MGDRNASAAVPGGTNGCRGNAANRSIRAHFGGGENDFDGGAPSRHCVFACGRGQARLSRFQGWRAGFLYAGWKARNCFSALTCQTSNRALAAKVTLRACAPSGWPKMSERRPGLWRAEEQQPCDGPNDEGIDCRNGRLANATLPINRVNWGTWAFQTRRGLRKRLALSR